MLISSSRLTKGLHRFKHSVTSLFPAAAEHSGKMLHELWQTGYYECCPRPTGPGEDRHGDKLAFQPRASRKATAPSEAPLHRAATWAGPVPGRKHERTLGWDSIRMNRVWWDIELVNTKGTIGSTLHKAVE